MDRVYSNAPKLDLLGKATTRRAEATTRSGSPSNVKSFSRSSLGGGLNPAMATLAANEPGAPVAVEAPADWPTSATGTFDRRSPSLSIHANFPSSKIFNVAFNTASLVADGFAAGFAGVRSRDPKKDFKESQSAP